MIRVARLGGDSVTQVDYPKAVAYSFDSNNNCTLFSDVQARKPLTTLAAGVWLEVEVVDG